MTELPDEASPFRPVKFAPWPDDGIIPGASMEDVMGLTSCALPAGSLGEPLEPRAGGFLIPPGAFDKLIGVIGNAQPVVGATKVVSFMHVSADLLDDSMTINLTPPTAEERAASEARWATYRAEQQAKHAAAVAEWHQLRDRHADSPAVLAVLDIHQPDSDGSLECQHPYFGYESDAEDWPCSTYVAIRDAEG